MKHKTYAANLRQRRLDNKVNSNFKGQPIPGVRTEAALWRKTRSQGRRAAKKRNEEMARQQRENSRAQSVA